jgi:hypothetical protein
MVLALVATLASFRSEHLCLEGVTYPPELLLEELKPVQQLSIGQPGQIGVMLLLQQMSYAADLLKNGGTDARGC